MKQYVCKDCGEAATSLAAARRHAKTAGPIWDPVKGYDRQHGLELREVEAS